jgi:hypothetical protein
MPGRDGEEREREIESAHVHLYARLLIFAVSLRVGRAAQRRWTGTRQPCAARAEHTSCTHPICSAFRLCW